MFYLTYSSTLSLTSALGGVVYQRYAPAALHPEKRQGTHCSGDRMGPKAGLYGCGYDQLIVRPVAIRYTD